MFWVAEISRRLMPMAWPFLPATFDMSKLRTYCLSEEAKPVEGLMLGVSVVSVPFALRTNSISVAFAGMASVITRENLEFTRGSTIDSVMSSADDTVTCFVAQKVSTTFFSGRVTREVETIFATTLESVIPELTLCPTATKVYMPSGKRNSILPKPD